MSAEANVLFKMEMRDRLASLLTCSEMENVMTAIDDIMCNYEMERNKYEETGDDIMLDAYLEAKRVEGRSEKTLERYEYVIRRLLQDTGVRTQQINTYHIRKYLAKEKERSIADSTLKGTREVFSGYFGWLHRDGLMAKNVMGNIGPIKCAKKKKEVFSDIEMHEMKCGCENLRDRAIVYMLKATGCRVSEITGLNRRDVDLNDGMCTVTGKGNKQRVVYMDDVTAAVLGEYLDARKDATPALFVSLKNDTQRLLPGGLRIMLKRLEERTGVQHVHPHKFRRTEITNLVNRGMPIEQVKTLAGHEKIDTTMKYVNVSEANVKHSYHQYA